MPRMFLSRTITRIPTLMLDDIAGEANHREGREEETRKRAKGGGGDMERGRREKGEGEEKEKESVGWFVEKQNNQQQQQKKKKKPLKQKGRQRRINCTI